MTSERSLKAQAYVVLHPDSFRPEFDIWLNQNWPIFAAFEHHALQVWNRGYRHYSARTIAEYIRHHTLLTEGDGLFKLNDHWTKSMARMFIVLHPECDGLFEFRSPVMAPSGRQAA